MSRAIIEKELTQGVVPIGTPKAYQYDQSLVESAVATVRQGLVELDDYTDVKKGEYLGYATTILQAIQSQYGYPFVASTVSAMTDITKIYVYTGTETGYTAGNWYYNNGSAWVSGGVFNSVDATTRAEMNLFGIDDLLWDGGNFDQGTTNTSAEVEYTIDRVNKCVTVIGTANGISFTRMFYSLSSLPSGMVAGGTYIAHIEQDANVGILISYYKNNQSGGTTLVNTYGKTLDRFTIPSDATGLLIRVQVKEGDTANATVYPFISNDNTYSLPELYDKEFKSLGSISPDEDFNGFTTFGYYLISANSQKVPSLTNPLPNTAVGLLMVLPNVNGIITQICFSNISEKNYIRRYSSTQGTWTSWIPFINTEYYMKKMGGNSIPYNTDFNDLTDTSYGLVNAGSSTGYVNCPTTSSGVLQVFNTGTIVTQVFEGTKTTEHYTRRRYQDEWSDWVGMQGRKSLKILSLGNSGHQDMLTYVPFIMKNVAPELDLTLGITYVSGASINKQLELFDNDTAEISFDLYRAGSNSWSIKGSQTMKQCLLAEDWDVIMVGQNSTLQMNFANYSDIPELLDKVGTYVGTDHDNYVGHPVKFGYLGPQVRIANNSMVMIETPDSYPNYMNALQQAMDAYPLEFAIVGGTAVMNARGTDLAQYGDAEFLDVHGNVVLTGQMNYDYAHMQEGIGCMVGSYCSVLGILELAGINNRSILGEQTRPDETWVNARNIPGKNWSGTVVGISDENCLIAQKCAIMAHKKPYEISTIY